MCARVRVCVRGQLSRVIDAVLAANPSLHYYQVACLIPTTETLHPQP